MPIKDTKQIIKAYNKGLSLARVAEKFGYKSPNTIKNILIKNNIQIRTRAGYKKPFNENYFSEINTQNKAYILGFLMADGNVYERNKSQPCIRMELNIKDKYILQAIRKELKISNKVRYTRKNCCVLSWHSEKMFNDLIKLGVVPNKTGKEIIPNIPEHLMSHFIRGFFDGDGWCTNTTSHKKNKGSRKNIGFVSNQKFLNDLQHFLNLKINTSIHAISERKGCYQLLYTSKKDVNNIINYMYQDANMYLKRKYDSCYQVYVNTEVTSLKN